jgi:hypothetical protein
MDRRTLIAATVATLAFATLGAAFAGAAKKPKNGNFEKGNLSGWQVLDLPGESETDTWYVYSGTTLPNPFDMEPLRRGIGTPAPFTAPPQGDFAAVTVQGGPGTHILHRTLKLKKGKTHKLKMRVYYRNNDDFFSPNSLDTDGGFDNQQYRIDLLKKNAPLDSVDGDDILKRIFGTEPGDPSEIQPKKLRVNLTKFAGKTVRLRFAEADNQGEFNAAVDAVKLKSKPEK